MLVLTRKAGEEVVIESEGREIVVTVLKVQGKSISLGIEAPDSCRIYRGELIADGQAAREEEPATAGAPQ